jgi:hypothetical protein
MSEWYRIVGKGETPERLKSLPRSSNGPTMDPAAMCSWALRSKIASSIISEEAHDLAGSSFFAIQYDAGSKKVAYSLRR